MVSLIATLFSFWVFSFAIECVQIRIETIVSKISIFPKLILFWELCYLSVANCHEAIVIVKLIM